MAWPERSTKMPIYKVTSKNCIGFVKFVVTKDIDGDDTLGQETSIKLGVMVWQEVHYKVDFK